MPGFAFVSSCKSFFGYVPAYWVNKQLFKSSFCYLYRLPASFVYTLPDRFLTISADKKQKIIFFAQN